MSLANAEIQRGLGANGTFQSKIINYSERCVQPCLRDKVEACGVVSGELTTAYHLMCLARGGAVLGAAG